MLVDFLRRYKWQLFCFFLVIVCAVSGVERTIRETRTEAAISAGECPETLPQELPVIRQDGPEMAAYPVGDDQLLVAVYRAQGGEVWLPPAGLIAVAAVGVMSDTLELRRGDGEHVLTLVGSGDFE